MTERDTNMDGQSVPATNETFIANKAYIAPSEDGLQINPSELSNVAEGIQNTSISEGQPIIGNQEISDEVLQAVARKYTTKHGTAKAFAIQAQIKRASRRLLLAERAKKLTCVCKETGIVSLLEVPSIPGFALIYQHPLADLENARGIAQKGAEYLNRLDTQTLAGILLVLANAYNLFRFQESDSGAQKNAVLRTAGKDIIVDAILLIEGSIHSRNIQFLPKLSLVVDMFHDDKISMETRLRAYLTLLSEAIAEPDKSIYDENAAPKKIGRPLYIRDVEKNEKRLSYMARQEIASAKKELASDAKIAKSLTSNLVALGFAKPAMKAFMAQIFGDNGMALIAVDQMMIDMLITQKLATFDHDDARQLIAILKKDRKALRLDISELDEVDDPAPGQEDAIEDSSDFRTEAEKEFADNLAEDAANDLESQSEELHPPEGLSKIEQILWRKKVEAASGKVRAVQNTSIPSTHTYIPSSEKQKMGN